MRTARAALAAALLVFAPEAAHAAVVSYAAPAGNLPAEHWRGGAYDAILPSGRIVTPAGTSVVTGMDGLGLALTPDGRFAIVSNDDAGNSDVRSLLDAEATGGSSLAVVDTATMSVVDRFHAPNETFWIGALAAADPANPAQTLVLASGGASGVVDVFTLDEAGHLTPDAVHASIALPGAVAGTLVLSADGRRAYVVDTAGTAVDTIDLATRSAVGTPQLVGYAPFGAALAGDRLLVTDEGLMRYAKLAQPAAAPAFRTPPPDPARASALSLLALDAEGMPSSTPQAQPFAGAIPLDRAPDGLRIVGGAHPTAIVTTASGAYAYVAMTNVDRVATVALRGAPRVVGGTELRLFDRGPYGTQPAALALSRDGKRLYVALAGLDAVAVIDAHDPLHLHRLGLIPTGWYPTALALSNDGRTLYVENTKGFGHDAGANVASSRDSAGAVWSTLQKIDLATVKLSSATLGTLGNTREVLARPPVYPKQITHVVVVLEGGRTFDSVLGDLGAPHGDPALALAGENVTPNLHALARRYGFAANLYADAPDAHAGEEAATAGIATLFAQRRVLAGVGADARGECPDDYPRLGSIFNELARHRLAYRDYGTLLDVDGFDAGGGATTDPPNAAGLGGWYTEDVPAPAVLADHVDASYPAWNATVSDDQRAGEFVRDYGHLASIGRQPRYTEIALPDAGTAQGAADADAALGTIVQYLSRLPSWRETALFVVPVDATIGRDHVDADRSYAVVVSPYAKPHYVSVRHLSTASVLKTSEELLHVGTLSLGDLLASDMSDFFVPRLVDAAPYATVPVPPQTPGV
ncbi:MAG TPA: hypothetical protein VFB22_02835 [Candidatus Baltobacteraceae bacterium]|nr:hypothetical protein [Candidatus Baltobacteraceae bacterium]